MTRTFVRPASRAATEATTGTLASWSPTRALTLPVRLPADFVSSASVTKQSTSPRAIFAPPDESDVLDGDEAGHFDFQREARINNSIEFELEVPLGDRIDVQLTEIEPIEATHA